MKMFLSGIEMRPLVLRPGMLWGLLSYYYLKNHDTFERALDYHEELIIDSGAHSFQTGKKVEWEKYTNQYAEWIAKKDNKKIVGFFEMDVDNMLGYERVLRLREILESASKKIIPVWHKNRGIDDYFKMTKEFSGRVVAISGFVNQDIRDSQYINFLKVAWDNGCKLHALGMTRKEILDSVPFDYTDSISWLAGEFYGRFEDGMKFRKGKGITKEKQEWLYFVARKQQESYYLKWMNYRENYLRRKYERENSDPVGKKNKVSETSERRETGNLF